VTDDRGIELEAQQVDNYGLSTHAMAVNMDVRLRLYRIDGLRMFLDSLDLSPFDQHREAAGMASESVSGNPQARRLLFEVEKRSPVFAGVNFDGQGVGTAGWKAGNVRDKRVGVDGAEICVVWIGLPAVRALHHKIRRRDGLSMRGEGREVKLMGGEPEFGSKSPAGWKDGDGNYRGAQGNGKKWV
jgi:hypothetical protein